MWVQVALLVISMVMQYMAARKMAKQKPPVGEVKIPNIDNVQPIGVLFGTREIRQPNVLWYGDITTTPIKTKAGGKK